MSIAAVHIANSLQRALDSLLGFIPNILGFLVILVVGYLIARVVKTVVAKVLEKVGVDRALKSSSAGQYVERVSPDAHPSRLIGAVALGLGGREIAHDMLSSAYGSAQDNRDQVKQDMQTGRDRAQQQTEQVKHRAQDGTSATTPGAHSQV